MQQLVESYEIRDRTGQLATECRKSRILFDVAMIYCHLYPHWSYPKLWSILRDFPEYKAMKSQQAQQTLKLAVKTAKAYRRGLAGYKKDPKKYTGCPKRYNPDRASKLLVTIFTNQDCVIRNGVVRISKDLKIPYTGSHSGRNKTATFNQVRIVHIRDDIFKIEVVYSVPKPPKPTSHTEYLGIDLGLDCIAGIATTSGKSYLISGKKMKGIIADYEYLTSEKTCKIQKVMKNGVLKEYKLPRSKSKAGHKKKNRALDYLHKISRRIVNIALNEKVGDIVIGHNHDWTRGVNLGKTNNRNMTQFGFAKLIQLVKYKAEILGIRVHLVKEPYTSKCDFLANEPVKKKDDKKYLGSRTNRGRFESSTGQIIHADINASFNMIKKYVDLNWSIDRWKYERVQQRGRLLRPVTLTTG